MVGGGEVASDTPRRVPWVVVVVIVIVANLLASTPYSRWKVLRLA